MTHRLSGKKKRSSRFVCMNLVSSFIRGFREENGTHLPRLCVLSISSAVVTVTSLLKVALPKLGKSHLGV